MVLAAQQCEKPAVLWEAELGHTPPIKSREPWSQQFVFQSTHSECVRWLGTFFLGPGTNFLQWKGKKRSSEQNLPLKMETNLLYKFVFFYLEIGMCWLVAFFLSHLLQDLRQVTQALACSSPLFLLPPLYSVQSVTEVVGLHTS